MPSLRSLDTGLIKRGNLDFTLIICGCCIVFPWLEVLGNLNRQRLRTKMVDPYFQMSVYSPVSPVQIKNHRRSEPTPQKDGMPNELVQIFNDIKSKGRDQRDRDGPRIIRR